MAQDQDRGETASSEKQSPKTPVPPHLKGVIAKILWAQEHLDVVHEDVLAYLDVCKQVASYDTVMYTKQNAVSIRQTPLPEPDWRIGLRIGDCVHNLRSALDHLWKRLKDDGNFPMFSANDGKKGWLALRAGILSGIPVEAHAIIDSLQPCSMGDNAPLHPLAILNRLSRIDKHETFHLTTARAMDTRFTFIDIDSGQTVATIAPDLLPLDTDAEIIIRDVPDTVAKPNMKVNTKGTLYVTFKEPGPWGLKPVQEVIQGSLNFIRRSVVGPLAPFTK